MIAYIADERIVLITCFFRFACIFTCICSFNIQNLQHQNHCFLCYYDQWNVFMFIPPIPSVAWEYCKDDESHQWDG